MKAYEKLSHLFSGWDLVQVENMDRIGGQLRFYRRKGDRRFK